jgi:molybdopterin converting factor small subunit
MRVTVRVFARLRDLAGRGEWPCDLTSHASASVADVWRDVIQEHPSLEPFAGSVSCAVNARFARMHTTLNDGDEVAFLPPVSGG